MRFTRYVALGDSQTEGLLDPDGRGGFRGWADRLAEALAIGNPHLQYANLAVRGKRLAAIRAEQLDAAVQLAPDLATVMGGLNDLMHPSVDLEALADDLAALLTGLRATGATVVTNTFPDPSTLAPLFRRLAPRVLAHNSRIRAVAAESDVLLVDFAERGVGTDLRIWSRDRIHANPFGHRLIAAAFADTLGLAGFAEWTDPLPPAARSGRLRRATGEARWLAADVAPWMWRRARGRSTADGRTAKRPRLAPVAPIFHIVEPADWPASGAYRPPSLTAEGFVHFSFADQVAASANRHYAEAVELQVVEVDASAIGAPVRVEDTTGSGTAFPHVYGPVSTSAALAVHRLHRGADGSWQFTPGTDRATPDR